MKLIKSNVVGLLGVPGAGEKPVVLKPGLNEISDADWRIMAGHPGIQRRLEEGVLECIESESEAEDPVSALCAMKPEAAKKAAAQTIDLSLLSQWLAAEKRAAVKKAIQAQIEALKAPAEYRTSPGDEG